MTSVLEPVQVEEIVVLVVDDDAEDRVIIDRMLAVAGTGVARYRVLEHDGSEGLDQCLRDGGFDCVLLDHRLGGSLGSEVLKRYTAEVDQVPVVMLTDQETEEVVADCLQHGAAEFLAKHDLKPKVLDRAIRYSLRQHRLRRELAQSQRRIAANERMAAIGMIAAGIAHEFNNLNMMVLGNVEYAASLIGDHPASRRLEHVMEAVERGSRITASLISMARGGVPLGDAGSDASEVAHEVLRLVDPAVRIGGVDVGCEVEGEPWVAMEGHELQQVLMALVVNALHALLATAEPRLDVRIVARGDRVVVSIADNGVGIEPNDREKIFQPFFSAKGPFDKAGRYPDGVEGTGLGLALAEHLVTRRGGVMDCVGRPQAGTRMELSLPTAAQAIRADESSAIIPISHPAQGIDLLLVDPDLHTLRLLTTACLGDGRELRPVTSGPQALAAVDQRVPDVVICPLALDAGDGRNLVETLATRIDAEDIDLVLVSESPLAREHLLHLPFRSLRTLITPLGTRRLDEVVSRIQSTR